MSMIEHLRLRWSLWLLQQRIDAAAESKAYHEKTGHLCLALAERDARILRDSRAQLERLSTALSQGVAA